MSKTQIMTRNQNHDDEASSSGKRPKTCRPWSDLNHDLLLLVMMQLGFGDYYSFSRVCKSWMLLAHSNKNKFMESRPPMSITISTDADENICCYLKDFEGRKVKSILPNFSSGDLIGFTCGYLIFIMREAHDFWLWNPISRNQLHFPDFPFDFGPGLLNRAILVISPSLSGWVFVVIYDGEIWYSVVGKGAWKHVSYSVRIHDIYAFKGKIYTLSYDIVYPVVEERGRLCELTLKPEPKFTLLETMNHLSFEFFTPTTFVSSCDNIYVMDWSVARLYELDLGERKWVKPCEKTMEEYAFF